MVRKVKKTRQQAKTVFFVTIAPDHIRNTLIFLAKFFLTDSCFSIYIYIYIYIIVGSYVFFVFLILNYFFYIFKYFNVLIPEIIF